MDFVDVREPSMVLYCAVGFAIHTYIHIYIYEFSRATDRETSFRTPPFCTLAKRRMIL